MYLFHRGSYRFETSPWFPADVLSQEDLPQDFETVYHPVLFMWSVQSVWSISSVSSIWLDQTKRIHQENQIG